MGNNYFNHLCDYSSECDNNGTDICKQCSRRIFINDYFKRKGPPVLNYLWKKDDDK